MPTTRSDGAFGRSATVIVSPSATAPPAESLDTAISPGARGQRPSPTVSVSSGPPGPDLPTTTTDGMVRPRTVRSTVVCGYGPAAAVTPDRCAVPRSVLSGVDLAKAATTCAPCWRAKEWSKGEFEATSSATASTVVVVD